MQEEQYKHLKNDLAKLIQMIGQNTFQAYKDSEGLRKLFENVSKKNKLYI